MIKYKLLSKGCIVAYSESDTRSKLIDPKIKGSDWLESNIIRDCFFREEYFELQREIYR